MNNKDYDEIVKNVPQFGTLQEITKDMYDHPFRRHYICLEDLRDFINKIPIHKRKLQYNKNTWRLNNQIAPPNIKCACGCNLFHYEYDDKANIIFTVCNACDRDMGQVIPKFTEMILSEGIWK